MVTENICALATPTEIGKQYFDIQQDKYEILL